MDGWTAGCEMMKGDPDGNTLIRSSSYAPWSWPVVNVDVWPNDGMVDEVIEESKHQASSSVIRKISRPTPKRFQSAFSGRGVFER